MTVTLTGEELAAIIVLVFLAGVLTTKSVYDRRHDEGEDER